MQLFIVFDNFSKTVQGVFDTDSAAQSGIDSYNKEYRAVSSQFSIIKRTLNQRIVNETPLTFGKTPSSWSLNPAEEPFNSGWTYEGRNSSNI